MNIALTIPLADSWGMHNGGGWWILGAAAMMLFMGGMMWMMMRGMRGGSSSDSFASPDNYVSTESPAQTLKRRLAEGEISIEEYHARREALVDDTAESRGDRDREQQLTAAGAGQDTQP